MVADLGLELVDTPEQADFLFLTGTEIPPLTLDDYRAVLERAAVRDLPMVCSNPDHVAPSGTELVIAPGTIAAMYEAMGGTVRYIGKPHAPIYGACLDALEGLDWARSWPSAIRSSTTSRVRTKSASPAASSPAASTPASSRRAARAPTTSGNSRS